MGDYGHELRFGAFLTPSESAVELALLAERAGLDLVSFQDHPYQPRFLDTWTLLSFVAARTSRIAIAPNVLNLPLRPPAVVARAAASVDRLSGGRFELGIGAGGFWDAIEAMGGRRLTPGQSVDALAEALDVMRALWDIEERRGVQFEGEWYRVAGAKRGPAPLHRIGFWIGAYKPRMLALTGRVGDGWLPSEPYLEAGDLARGNAALDAAAVEAGRDPRAIRRLLNLSEDLSPERLTALALEDGIGTFIVMGDDPAVLQRFAEEVAPAVREAVERERNEDSLPAPTKPSSTPIHPESEYARLGVTPTLDDGTRLTAATPWDESTRPRRTPSGTDITYTRQGKLVGQHLIDVHDMLRRELTELRDVVEQVRSGVLSAGDARSALNDMALRQNDWTLGAFCARYCGVVAQHHGLEDGAVFPHLARSDASLEPVIDRLTEEHLVIHDAIGEIDKALVAHINAPTDFDRLQAAIDYLTDALLSHLSYEEHELVEPLARLGFYPDQL